VRRRKRERLPARSTARNAQPSPPAGGGGENPPLIDTPATFQLRSVVSRLGLRTLARRGLKVRVACTGAMTGQASLVVSSAVARRLALGRRMLASRSVRCFGAETRTVTLKPSTALGRKLVRSRRNVKVALQVRMRDEGKTTTITRSVTLRR
jgi:hypothetical protein